MGSGGNGRRTFEFDGHTFLWPSGLNPEDMLAACLSIFLDLASRARRGDPLAAELLRNSPIGTIRAADGRAYWQRGRADGGQSNPPDPVAQDGEHSNDGCGPDADRGSGEGEAAEGKDEVPVAPVAVGTPRRSWRLAWVAATLVLAALAAGALNLIPLRPRVDVAPSKAGPGVLRHRADSGK